MATQFPQTTSPEAQIPPHLTNVNTSKSATASPEVFGPPTWTYLHISTAHLPEDLSPITAAHVKNTLFAVPSMVPCEKCTIHMGNYIESRRGDIEKATKGSMFFKITVDMHNFVNKRLNKPTYSYEDAFRVWKGVERK